MTEPQPTALAEWKKHWLLVLAATAGFTFPATATSSLGLFMEPLHKEFGWGRAEISSGLFSVSVLAVILAPFVGALIDRYGPRKIGIPGIIMAIAAIASFSLANGSLALWIALWFFFGIAALFSKPTIWTAATSDAFSTSRGLALGVVLCGSAIAQTFAPKIAQVLIDGYGWRFAYRAMAAGWGGLVLVLLLLFFHDARRHGAATAGTDAPQAAPLAAMPGLTFRQALRSRPILMLAGALLVASLVNAGVSIHLVPILGETGLSRGQAAEIAGLGGIAGIVGKLATGWLIDRYKGSLIPFTSFTIPALAFALLWQPQHTTLLTAAAVFLLGYGAGAVMQSAAYLVSRYGGMRSFGKVYGSFTSIMGLSLGVGPWLAGRAFDLTGSYDTILLAAIPMNLLAGLLVIGLGPYPVFATDAADEAVRG